jgi:SAM-dependent methyltransferase
MNPVGLARRSVRKVVRRALATASVRRLVEGELARVAKATTTATPKAMPTFTDRRGVVHHLDPTLRDRLKPEWRAMCDPEAGGAKATDDDLRWRARKAAKSIGELERVLAVTAGAGLTGRILEVGCYDGSAAFELSRRDGTRVVASDLARYYVVQRPGRPQDDAIAAEEEVLAALRGRARAVAGVPQGTVEFIEDDIGASTLEQDSFDLIVSFEVLEHVRRPHDALAGMARLLRPGGVIYHDYNPFFSVIGGHSLVTLDLPWGHARLDDNDVERYLREIRPSEAEQALRFYRESLNRMTQADLRAAVSGAGLELVALLPWNQRSLTSELSREVVADVRRNYPTATIDDLLGTFVIVIARRPAVQA